MSGGVKSPWYRLAEGPSLWAQMGGGGSEPGGRLRLGMLLQSQAVSSSPLVFRDVSHPWTPDTEDME